MQKLTIIAALALAACTATKDDSGDTAAATDSGTTDSGTTDTGTPAPSASAEWNATGVSITMTNATGPFKIGMAETTEGGWLGEDCLTDATCHPLAVGTTLTLTSVNTIPEVTFGSKTLLKSTMEAGITYFVSNAEGCWVWGHDVSYYAAKSCTAL